jgi:FixJ family two-component response regulator
MVFGVADDNVPMRESPKNLIRAVGLQAEVFISVQRFVHSHVYRAAG